MEPRETKAEAIREAVREALAADDAERFAARLQASGLDDATLAACLAALRELEAETMLEPASGVSPIRATVPRWRKRVAAGWRGLRPQIVDALWKVGAALAAAAAAGLLGLGK